MTNLTPPSWMAEIEPPASMDDYGQVVPLRNGEPAGWRTMASPADKQPALPLATLDLSSVPVSDVPPRAWIVQDLIPDRNVTDLSGDGGLGKSLLVLQLGIAMTAGRDWIGTMPEVGPVLYVSCEDERDEILRRRNSIIAGIGLDPSDMDGFHLLDLTSAETTELAAPGDRGAIGLTDLFRQLEATVRQILPKLVILDTRADVFGGNELSRVQVRSFVRALRKLCLDNDLAVILISHPSVSGMASGSGQSGSTGWGNSVRSRLYLTAPKAEADAEPDASIRVLSNKKANYGPRGAEIVLRWDSGLFRPESGALSGFDRDAQERKVELRFLQLLDERAQQNRRTNSSSGPNYAPKAFAGMDKTIGARKFKAAMERLFTNGEIIVAPYENKGKQSSEIVITEAGFARIRTPF